MNHHLSIVLLLISCIVLVSASAQLSQDPQFAGFQGQSFQFHGLPDEHFNLISSPRLQINSHFVFLANGQCGYNDTLCWTHPGTYVDILGISIGLVHIRMIANSHDQGLSLSINHQQLGIGKYPFQDQQQSVLIHMVDERTVIMHTTLLSMTIHNADFFFNLEVSLHDESLLKLGATPHTITDHVLCHQERDVQDMDKEEDEDEDEKLVKNKMKRDHGPIEAELMNKYGGHQVPLHGLIGQTWRAATVCGKSWVGSVQDYMPSDLFASDYRFNYFQA